MSDFNAMSEILKQIENSEIHPNSIVLVGYKTFNRIPRKLKKKIKSNNRFVLLWDWDLNKCIWYKILEKKIEL